MKILVTFKCVPDPEDPVVPGLADSDVKKIMNPFDETALEEAVRLKEKDICDEVVALTVGNEMVAEQVRQAFAMGADRVIHVEDDRNLDSYAVSRIIAAIIRIEEPDLVLMGKQAIDDDAGQVGQMLAGLLDWPQSTCISRLELEVGAIPKAVCERETDRGLERLRMGLPGVITADLRLNEPRYVSLSAMMKARRKRAETIDVDDLNVRVEPMLEVISSKATAKRPEGIFVSDSQELIAQLVNRKHI
jgi:electron transfer flavoprotein beta subunit